MTVPGIGPLAASALEASAGNGHQFANGRFLAAWLGVVPRQYSTGGKTTLLSISKGGNAYLGRLLIHGARSCVQTCDRQRHPLGGWITKLEQRMHRNKVIVALANKIARGSMEDSDQARGDLSLVGSLSQVALAKFALQRLMTQRLIGML
jgi:transposase